MKRHVHTAHVDTNVREAACLMRDQRIGFLPVCDAHGHTLGVVTDRDLALRVCAEGLDAETTPLSAIMTRDPLTCRADDSLEAAEQAMLRRKFRRVVVLDEVGRIAGLITLADVAHYQSPFQMAQFVRTLTENRLRVEK